ncbi:IS66 family insertion sequence element accessory protein TnpB [Salmonella enterica]|nr:IS66 family insertion sequence element accessory protein TnpB [Salmonella enterica]EJX4476457.1 IS66 family insertion sequence element accessory protein TnpB [Salmonella enterica]EKS4544972.1 IS66 family insertion sequence element accessory protein TnpB [Salmonella enterica]EKS4549608.1 IS66 family insertion sequence element accessory protein TnpB [Salmonella enterica]EKS4822777.1 IS66 family insertion sequence element accessory protein TnpB [Salmonella enterica]
MDLPVIDHSIEPLNRLLGSTAPQPPRFAWPSARDGKVFLTPAQLAMLMEGIDWRQPKRLLTSLTML